MSENLDVGDAARQGAIQASPIRTDVADGKVDIHREEHIDSKYFVNVKRGLALVLNFVNFDANHKWSYYDMKLRRNVLPRRDGSDVDAEQVYRTLKKFGFEFYQRPGLTNTPYGLVDGDQETASALLQSLAQEDEKLAKTDCLTIVVMSHGKDGKVATKNKFLDIEEHLISPFRNDECAGLKGKPKLFFIQACRGEKLGKGVEVPERMLMSQFQEETDALTPAITIPVEADVLVAYATVPGNISIRNQFNGSWFLQTLCVLLQKYAHQLDIHQILAIVCHEVSLRVANGTQVLGGKQCPMFISRLRHIVNFIEAPL